MSSDEDRLRRLFGEMVGQRDPFELIMDVFSRNAEDAEQKLEREHPRTRQSMRGNPPINGLKDALVQALDQEALDTLEQVTGSSAHAIVREKLGDDARAVTIISFLKDGSLSISQAGVDEQGRVGAQNVALGFAGVEALVKVIERGPHPQEAEQDQPRVGDYAAGNRVENGEPHEGVLVSETENMALLVGTQGGYIVSKPLSWVRDGKVIEDDVQKYRHTEQVRNFLNFAEDYRRQQEGEGHHPV